MRPKEKSIVVHPESLPPKQRRALRRVLRPRTAVFSRRFSPESIAAWDRASAAAGMSVTDWVERALDEVAAKQARKV